jgi:hypothetical protein
MDAINHQAAAKNYSIQLNKSINIYSTQIDSNQDYEMKNITTMKAK